MGTERMMGIIIVLNKFSLMGILSATAPNAKLM
jgi:hypothetical protein